MHVVDVRKGASGHKKLAPILFINTTGKGVL